MIAARIESGIKRPFLELVWNSRAVRTQIEASARTTNGTYKVNQTMLEAVAFICPPIDLQSNLANRIAAIENLKSSQETTLSELDQLFASLQHRAFQGEL